MTSVTLLSPAGQTVAVLTLSPGTSLMEAAVQANVSGIEAECGGSLICATCHVYVAEGDQARLPPPSPDENAMLEFVAAERRPGSRLSCQLIGSNELESLTVELPERQIA
jgi:ferredoxin, 2Fe-2S